MPPGPQGRDPTKKQGKIRLRCATATGPDTAEICHSHMSGQDEKDIKNNKDAKDMTENNSDTEKMKKVDDMGVLGCEKVTENLKASEGFGSRFLRLYRR